MVVQNILDLSIAHVSFVITITRIAFDNEYMPQTICISFPNHTRHLNTSYIRCYSFLLEGCVGVSMTTIPKGPCICSMVHCSVDDASPVFFSHEYHPNHIQPLRAEQLGIEPS